MSWAEATEQKENEVNRLTAKIAAFIGSSLSNPKINIGKCKNCPESFDSAQDKLLRRISVHSLLA
jgi:hypothetical protein